MTQPEAASHVRRFRLSIPGLRPAVAIGLAVFLVATGTLAGNAYWSATTSKAATATAAAVGSASTGADALTVAYVHAFAPGGIVSVGATTKSVTIKNTGATPLNYSVSVTGGSAAVTLQLWKQGATCASSTAVPTNATAGTLAAPPSMPTDATSAAAGASIYLCVRTTLTGELTVAIAPSISFTGRVGDNWSATSSATFTQSMLYHWFAVKHTAASQYGTCLDSPGSSTAVGTSMIIYACHDPIKKNDNQSFRFEPVGSLFRLYIGVGTGDGPVVASASTTNGALVQLAAKTTTTGTPLNLQLWSIVAHGTAGDYQLKNSASGRCLTVSSDTWSTAFTTSTCSTATSGTAYRTQHFNFVEIP